MEVISVPKDRLAENAVDCAVKITGPVGKFIHKIITEHAEHSNCGHTYYDDEPRYDHSRGKHT